MNWRRVVFPQYLSGPKMDIICETSESVKDNAHFAGSPLSQDELQTLVVLPGSSHVPMSNSGLVVLVRTSLLTEGSVRIYIYFLTSWMTSSVTCLCISYANIFLVDFLKFFLCSKY